METLINKIQRKSIGLVHRYMNKEILQRKVFCIGLHKTGTTSLYAFAKMYGYKAIHLPGWDSHSGYLKEFEFFSDGGSHFDDQNEFDFKTLFKDYPDSLFILQTRDTKGWIASKLKHAGWNHQTVLEQNDEIKPGHLDWKYKSFMTIEKLIMHKYNYERKVLDFFKKNNPDRLISIDIIDKHTQKIR